MAWKTDGADSDGDAGRLCRCDGCGRLEAVYEGPIRAGLPGTLTKERYQVLRCPTLDVSYLHPFPSIDYESEEYRQRYNASGEVETYFRLHDDLQRANLRMLDGIPLRSKVIADFGCGAGAFLDLVRGTARQTIGVEPYEVFRSSLRERGHLGYAYGTDLSASENAGRVDVAVSFQVIEHVRDPRAFLHDMYRCLAPGGVACVATPNAADFLLELGGAAYQRFWYRTAHLWYFSPNAMTTLAQDVGFQVRRVGFMQNYDLGNALLWMREGAPRGNGRVPWIDETMNVVWKSQLEAKGLADWLYVILDKPGRTSDSA